MSSAVGLAVKLARYHAASGEGKAACTRAAADPPRLSAVSNPAMSCPVCGERCTCSSTGAASSLLDPEQYDASEERFAASLEEVQVESASRPDAPVAQGSDARQATGGDRGMDEGAMWRQEVTSRVEHYRARRRRPLRERSLPLDFERAVNREMTLGNLSDSAESEPAVARAEGKSGQAGAAEFSSSRELPPPDALPETNVIEFPRQAMLPVMPPSQEELAEPVIDRPRILDVSEEIATAAPLGDISVAPEEELRPEVTFELPLQGAPMSRRMFAGLIDAIMVSAAAIVFFMIAAKLGVPMPQARNGFLLALAAPCLFWAVYEYLFLVHAGTTPGLQIARLRLVTFEGVAVRRHTRRGRAVALVLSTWSLGLGLVWALLDEDTLCWHDRITRTYLVATSCR